MIKAIFLDLDNTLLNNPDTQFAEAFLQTAETYFSQRWGVAGMAQVMHDSVMVMQARRINLKTNTEVALDYITSVTGHPREHTEKALNGFFADGFTSLQNCTAMIPGTVEALSALQEAGYQIVIATNPIYPLAAVQQRLRWAGLKPDIDDYAFITSADNMHFTKPDPAYYAEILGRTGLEPDEVIMVGDSVKNDMVPASQVGLHTFHISQASDRAGTDLFRLIHNMPAYEDQSNGQHAFHPEPYMIEPQFRGHIGALMGLLHDIPDHVWHQHPIPEEWSPIQVVCHLADSERSVQRPRLSAIINQNNPFLADPKPPPRADQFPCVEAGMSIARRFAAERWWTIRFLRKLKPDDWHRPARHSIFGPTTLLEMAQFTARHDRLHLEQLCQTIGRCI